MDKTRDIQQNNSVPKEVGKDNIFTTITPFSKYLAMFLFIALPFVGFWLGYGYGEKNISVDNNSSVITEGVFERNGIVSDYNNKNIAESVFYKDNDNLLKSKPPNIIFVVNSEERRSTHENYCWDGECKDGIVSKLPDDQTLEVEVGQQIDFKINTKIKPDSLSLHVRDVVEDSINYPIDPSSIIKQRNSFESITSGSFVLDVDPGEYVISMSGHWEEGDVSSVIQVKVVDYASIVGGDTDYTKITDELIKSKVNLWKSGTDEEKWHALRWLKENVIKIGISQDEVKYLLGEPNDIYNDGRNSYFTNPYSGGVIILYENGVVSEISYFEV